MKDFGQLSEVYVQVSDVKKYLCDQQVTKSPGPDQLTAHLLKELANEISEPFTKIVNLSLQKGVFPAKWKDANFTPVTKSNPKNVVTNYRGIALLSILSKTFERCINVKLYSHVEDILSHNQHGFRKSRSCVTQLLDFVHSIAETLDKGEQTDVIYLDMAKAFDKITHEKLIHKLEMYGLRNPLLNWFRDYLTGRRHRVLVEDVSQNGKKFIREYHKAQF